MRGYARGDLGADDACKLHRIPASTESRPVPPSSFTFVPSLVKVKNRFLLMQCIVQEPASAGPLRSVHTFLRVTLKPKRESVNSNRREPEEAW